MGHALRRSDQETAMWAGESPRHCRHMTQLSTEARGSFANEIVGFITRRLPQINRECRDGLISVDAWTQEIQSWLDGALEMIADLDADSRRVLFRALTLIACSAERHSQVFGAQAGEVYRFLPGLEAALVFLAESDRVPYLTAYDLWMETSAAPVLSFTGEAWHRYFRDSVRGQVQLHGFINGILRDVVDAQYVVGTEHCLVMMRTAANAMAEARRLYQQMKHGITPAEFNEFRGWLPKTKIEGVTYPGPNAAWLHEMVSTDILFGMANEDHLRKNVLPFLDLFSPQGRRVLQGDMASVVTTLDVFAASLGFPDARVLGKSSDVEVAKAVSPGLSPAID